MKKLIVFLMPALFLMPAFCLGQYLNQVYDYDSTGDWGYKVFVEPDGDYFVVGSSLKDRWHLSAKRIAPNGTELMNKTILASNTYNYYRGEPNAILSTSSGYIVPLTVSRPTGMGNINLAALAKLNADGDTVWVKYYTDTTVNEDQLVSCNSLPDGGFALVGYREIGLNKRGLLIRVDSNGNALWSITHPVSAGFATAEYVGLDRILVGGMYSISVTVPPAFTYWRNQPWFIIYDMQGNLVDDTLYGNRFAGGGHIYKDLNGGYFHWSELDSFVNSSPSAAVNFPNYIAHLNDSFEITWLKHYADPNGKKYFSEVRQLTDSNYLIVGIYAGNLSTHIQDGWASKLDKNGNTIWSNYYFIDSTGEWEAYLIDAVERSDGSIVLTGRAQINDTSLEWRKADIWVLVIDSMGCIVPGCAPTKNQEPLSASPNFSIYPNPTTGTFSVKSKAAGILTICNLQGQEIARCNVIAGVTEIKMPSVSSGVYITSILWTDNKKSFVRLVYQP